MPSVSCPQCAKPVTIPEGMSGKQIRCPSCRKVFPIGTEAVAAAPLPPTFGPQSKPVKPNAPAEPSSAAAPAARGNAAAAPKPPAGPVPPGPPLVPRPSNAGLAAKPAGGPVYPHIEKPPGQPARLTRVPSIRVAQIVMDYLAFGWSPEEMCRQHPHLAPADVHAAMGYYYDYRLDIEQEIMNELNQVTQDQAKAMPSAALLRVRAS